MSWAVNEGASTSATLTKYERMLLKSAVNKGASTSAALSKYDILGREEASPSAALSKYDILGREETSPSAALSKYDILGDEETSPSAALSKYDILGQEEALPSAALSKYDISGQEEAPPSATLSEYELLRLENMKNLQQEVGDLFNNTVQSAQKLNKNLKFRSKRKPAYRPGQRIKLFSKLEKSSNMKKTQSEDIRRSLRDKRKRINYDSNKENNDGKNKKRRQRYSHQKKFPLNKPKGLKPKFSRKVPRLDVSNVTQEMLDNIVYSSVGKKYSTDEGTTCHQCRQKTMDQKSFCRNKSCNGMRGMFCGFCLSRRYGEDVAEALLNPLWTCPPCLGRCNCSICRRDQGKDPTGQLAQVAKAKGYNSVYDLLKTIEKEPDNTNENPIDKCEPKNCNSVENNIELQNSDLIVPTSNQLNINNLNDEAVFVESNANNKLEPDNTNENPIDKCEPKNCNSVENNIELQNSDLIVPTSNQLNINNLNDEAVFVESNANNKLEQLKSKKNDYCGIKDEEQCNSENYIVEPRETSEMIIDKLYKKFILST
ncbi:unnamed protein product [Aphis gossypii]|uniref:Zinc-finger domain-containing protein n=1 Tax=Aphis gossypii TaxID=80765 RepID=A0A9P0J9E2_APHGO|nr:unnamed protein product [Aphis gossypii]